ncbi:M48 family metalloprotease [Alterisphingorhabdus coralli]|uniref:M48 family metalloprotease n=1 Tax=Alterisphingorhabdus coralli TaxID=3071408 RepID=A0AA97I078_9SPHN|nr:M48 family metalloprotease [Parasphingorhabdus sp. SCSIO 66989]WOE74133.1 M48 family metalloprotease [Parasphingorhabdus sp. SCSIO 66989]
MAKRLLTSAVAVSALLIGCSTPGSVGGVSSANAAQNEVRYLTDEEKKIGREAHPQLMQEFGGAYDSPQAAYVERIGKDIASYSGLGNAREEFTVTLLNSPVNNAFAVPGGYIYITRQLMALMNDEAELAGVLGHEVGHIDARHSQRRQRAAKRNNILGVLGQIGSAILLGDSAFGRLGQELFGRGSQLLTLSYSRGQEHEADDLGVLYLDRAGYDTQAVSTMLYSLALQNALEKRARGQTGRSVPSWASTHPDSAKRVRRSAKKAAKTEHSGTGKRNREAFLQQLDGLLYGDDPEQGVVQGNRFVHPTLGFAFNTPNGYSVNNGSRAVTVQGQGGQAQFSLAPYSNDLNAYVRSVFDALAKDNNRLPYGEIGRTTINGMPMAFSTARVNNGRQTVDVSVYAYEYSSDRAYHFVTITPAGRNNPFGQMIGSFAKVSGDEASSVRAKRIDVITVGQGDTVASLAAKMPFDNYQEERFRTLNGLANDARLTPGQKVKTVTF